MKLDKTIMTLDQQRAIFSNRKFLAMPVAGLIAWFITGISSLLLSICNTNGMGFIYCYREYRVFRYIHFKIYRRRFSR